MVSILLTAWLWMAQGTKYSLKHEKGASQITHWRRFLWRQLFRFIL